MKMIVLAASAAKSLDRIAEPARSAISEALTAYALGRPSDTTAMAGTSVVRLRIGDYRAIFDETANTITVLAIGHRREIYR